LQALRRTDFAAFLADFVLLAIVDVLLTSNCLSMRPFREAEFKARRKQKFTKNRSIEIFFVEPIEKKLFSAVQRTNLSRFSCSRFSRAFAQNISLMQNLSKSLSRLFKISRLRTSSPKTNFLVEYYCYSPTNKSAFPEFNFNTRARTRLTTPLF